MSTWPYYELQNECQHVELQLVLCVSRWEYGFVQSFGIILRPQFVTYRVESDMCVCVCKT